jgi:TolB protein
LLAAVFFLAVGPQTAATQRPAPAPQNLGGAPAVSPDGAWIAFTSDRDGSSQIYVIRPDGTGERRVTRSAETKGGIRWSSDGRRLLFVNYRDNAGHLFSVDLDGANQREVLTVPGREVELSPDGKHVLYSAGSFTATELMLADFDGAAARNARQINAAGSIAWNFKWSPDGSLVAYTCRDEMGRTQVCVMKSDGTQSRPLTTMSPEVGRAQVPAWSPDGKTIAFQASTPGGSSHIWVADAATRRATKLVDHSEAFLDEIPTWFPDGKRLAFQSNRTGRWEIWIVNVDGSGLAQVTR